MPTERYLTGIGAAPGLAIGRSIWWSKERPLIRSQSITNIQQEVSRFEQATQEAKKQIHLLRDKATIRMGDEEAAIFDAHLAFLDDPAYIGEMKNRIQREKKNAETICAAVTKEMYRMFSSLPDEYMRARADDIRDVGDRLLLILAGQKPFDPQFLSPGSIVVAHELTPSDTTLFPSGIAAMVTALGSKTAHTAIMARALGIPAVFGLGEAITQINDYDQLIVDGNRGTVVINPSHEVQQRMKRELKVQQKKQEQALQKATQAAFTRDGKRVQILANLGDPEEAEIALRHGAEGVGLFRTEFLYLNNDYWPSETEQLIAYRKVLEAFSSHPVVIRTLDIGGDKKLPYADFPYEENPFLGHRAIRFCLSNPSIFKTQLRALLRASVYGDLLILLPMVEKLDEIRATKALIQECRDELQQSKIPVADSIPVGIMVEVPAAAITADLLAREVDFMSIGTNDLTQYTLAADRGNEQVADYYDSLHPAVLRLVEHTCAAANKAGIPVGMCGELAGDPQITEILIGLGLDELSMSAQAIPQVKERIRHTHIQNAKAIANRALTLGDPTSIRELAQKRK